jgi:ABC-type nitrate/sulfonate/bicarbonate transport system substrate-binding protein
MKRFLAFPVIALAAVLALVPTGCSKKNPGEDGSYPVFTLAWSEYPSWSVFGFAGEHGLVNPAEGGEMGELEKKWKVDIVLKQGDYDTTITQYGSGAADAVCITNMDVLNPALGRKTTVILPTSTSAGADALIAVGFDKLEDMPKGTTVFGLDKSVSEYAFVRCLQKKGLNSADFKYSNMDPAAAAQALQTNQPSVKAIMVWNPFVLQTLRTNDKARRIVDSSLIPGEIVDSVAFSTDSLAKPGGDRAACCIINMFYAANNLLTNYEAFVALGSKFSNLNAEDMRQCCKETKFYGDEEIGVIVYDEQFRKVQTEIVKFCVERQIVTKTPSIGYGDGQADLNFDAAKWIKASEAGPK